MEYIKYFLRHIIDLPITIYLNLKVLPFRQAIYLPILFSHRLEVESIYRGSIVIDGTVKIKPFMIKLGVEGTPGVSDNRKSFLGLGKSAKIIFMGKTNISKGFSIRSSGVLKFGTNFYCNCNLSVICAKNIFLGDDCLLGWNIHIRDCDGHTLLQNGAKINSPKDVLIGNHVWIGQDVRILKGCKIPSNSIIAMNSCVTKKIEEGNTIIGGYPAKIIKREVDWEI